MTDNPSQTGLHQQAILSHIDGRSEVWGGGARRECYLPVILLGRFLCQADDKMAGELPGSM